MVERKYSIIRGALRNDFEEVRLALTENPDCINDQDDRVGITALHVAAADGNRKLVEFLLSMPGCDPFLEDHTSRKPHHLALAIGRSDILEIFEKIAVSEIQDLIEAEDRLYENSSINEPRP